MGARDQPREARIANVSGAVLRGAAGKERQAPAQIAELLAALLVEVQLVGADPDDQASAGRAVPDLVSQSSPASPLRDLVSALEAAGSERVLVVACDVATVTAELLLALIAFPESDAVVPRDAEGPRPLCGIYRRDVVLPEAHRLLASGELDPTRLLAAVETTYLEGPDLAAVTRP